METWAPSFDGVPCGFVALCEDVDTWKHESTADAFDKGRGAIPQLHVLHALHGDMRSCSKPPDPGIPHASETGHKLPRCHHSHVGPSQPKRGKLLWNQVELTHPKRLIILGLKSGGENGPT